MRLFPKRRGRAREAGSALVFYKRMDLAHLVHIEEVTFHYFSKCLYPYGERLHPRDRLPSSEGVSSGICSITLQIPPQPNLEPLRP